MSRQRFVKRGEPDSQVPSEHSLTPPTPRPTSQAALRAVADLKAGQARAAQGSGGGGGGTPDRLGSTRSVMYALYVVLLWLLQSGDSHDVRARRWAGA